MKWFKRKPKHKKYARTGRSIDMRRGTWGYNISLSKHPTVEDTQWSGSVWISRRPQVGDEIVWDNGHADIVSVITSVKPAPNVWDMSFIEGIAFEARISGGRIEEL